MRTRVLRFNWLVPSVAGVSIALTLLTGARGEIGVGAGEVGLVFCILIAFMRSFGSQSRGEGRHLLAMPHLLLLYGVFVLLPLTAIHFYANTPGSSMRDWLAYMLSFLLIFTLLQSRVDLSLAGKCFLFSISVIILYQYFNGGLSAWYSLRFTGGAKNPNQLALYCICGCVIAVSSFERKWLAAFFVGFLALFGLLSRSDAFDAALLLVGAMAVLVHVIPKKAIIPAGLPLLMGGAAFLIMYADSIFDLAGFEWSSADEGGARVILYTNGLLAWLRSFDSIIIGNGAGSFSGLTGPFGNSEAHNTPIDVLAIGGVVGLVVFYVFPLKFLWNAYNIRRLVLFSFMAGMIFFSFFHFVGRQPVWWFALLCAALSLRRGPAVGAA